MPRMQIVILAGGFGTRLGKFTGKTQKSMVRILGKPFLQYQIELLREEGIRRILLCIGYLGNQIKEYFGSGEKFRVDIQYSDEGSIPLGTGGALRKAEDLLDDHFFLMWGDSYLLLNYTEIWNASLKAQKDNNLGLMVVYKNYNKRVKSNVIVKHNKVALYDKWNSYPEMIYIDNGLSALNKAVLERIPPGKPFMMEKIFKELSQEGKMAAYETKQRFYEIGSISGLKEFETFISKHTFGQK